jgi:hypothetical protein
MLMSFVVCVQRSPSAQVRMQQSIKTSERTPHIKQPLPFAVGIAALV